jgi:hypothetical protein
MKSVGVAWTPDIGLAGERLFRDDAAPSMKRNENKCP